MNLCGFDLSKAQLGWVCTCFFRVTTANQFTDERHEARGYSRWMLVAMLRSCLSARSLAADLAARPGERTSHGWAE